jgi:hypothetical protein
VRQSFGKQPFIESSRVNSGNDDQIGDALACCRHLDLFWTELPNLGMQEKSVRIQGIDACTSTARVDRGSLRERERER